MQKINSLLPKIQRVKKAPQGSLFKQDFRLLNADHCPFCYHKLYWDLKRTAIRCKRKVCGFGLDKKTYEEIVSGKRLQDYKDHVKMMGR